MLCFISICTFRGEQFSPLAEVCVSHHEFGAVLIDVLDDARNIGYTSDFAGFNAVVSSNDTVFSVIKRANNDRRKQSVFLYGLSQFMQLEFAVHLERLIFPWDELIYRYFFFGILNSIVSFEEVCHVKFAGVA